MKKLIITLGALGLGIGGYTAVQMYANKALSAEVDKIAVQLEKESQLKIDYQSAEVNLFTKDVELSNIGFTSQEGVLVAQIASFTLIGYETDKISEHTSAVVEGLTLTEQFKSTSPETPKELLDATYDMQAMLNFDQATGESEFKMGFSASSVATMDFDFTVGNAQELMQVSLESYQLEQSKNPSVEAQLQLQSRMMMAMQQLQPSALNFKFSDKGQFKSVVEQQVAAGKMDMLSFQQQAQMQVDMLPLNDEAKQQMMQFVTGLSDLSISMKLGDALSFTAFSVKVSELADQPDELAKLLNLKVLGE